MKKIKIGRSNNNDIKIDDDSISREHVLIIKENSKISIEDLNSANGTFVNNKKITKTYINLNDEVKLGNHILDLQSILSESTDKTQLKTIVTANKTIFTEENNSKEKLSKIRIGRASDNEIILNYPQISSHHAEVTIDYGKYNIRDLGSLNGTFVNREKITQREINEYDLIHIGSVKINLNDIKQAFTHSESKDVSNEIIVLKPGINRIGRGKDNDIIVNHPMVSSFHAEIINTDGKLEIIDNNSTNGIFVNGIKVTRSFITLDDDISLGIFPLRISPAHKVSTFRKNEGIVLDEIVFQVKEKKSYKKILDDIELTVYPSEFVGLIGPSGSGKTTLLNLMNGYVKPSSGRVLINNFDLHKNQNLFKGLIGFVPQDDIIHRELTVFESLYYSAKLRLPKDTDEDEILNRVNYIIDRIELTRVKDVLIGSPEKKGISGGQRKRVNLAQELLTEPTILFLDEPTSGLDPRSDYKIMELLRELTNEGRVVILTTHHISKENFKLFDNIILLARGGKLAFYGPAFPDSTKFYGVDDPKNIFDKLEKDVSPEEIKNKYKRSTYYNDYVEKRKIDKRHQNDMKSNEKISGSRLKSSAIKQFFIFLRRFFKIKISDKQNTLILLLQSPILALLIGYTLNVNDPNNQFSFAQPIFIMIICAIFFGIINTSREIIGERPIYLRERKVFLKIYPYLLSKFSLLLIISLFQTACLVTIIYFMCGLKGDYFNYLLFTYIVSISSMSLGLLISTFVKTTDAAISLSIFALIPQIIYSGAIVHFSQMKTFVEYISYLCLSRWAYELFLIEEGRARNLIPQLEQTLITGGNNYEKCLTILVIWGLIYLLSVTVILKIRDNKNN